MSVRKFPAAVLTGVLLSFAGLNVASAQPANAWAQAGTTYTQHSSANGACPALDWHIVVGQNGALSGMVGADDMKTVFRVSGQIAGANFTMNGTEVGGTRTGAVNGQIQSDG